MCIRDRMITETTAEQRSSFIKYAESRIQKEYEENERFKKLNGSDEFLSITPYYTMSFDNEERREICDAIDNARFEGVSVKEACDSHFISPSTYHKWRRNFKIENFYKLKLKK